MNIAAARGVAIREFPLATGHGFADYLLYVDGEAVGVVEAKKRGTTLTGVEVQSQKYATGLPAGLPARVRPLPFLYQSTGVETRFTNGLDPEPKSRRIFHFHKPGTLAEWIAAEPLALPAEGGAPHPLSLRPSSLRGRLRHAMSFRAEDERGLRQVQVEAIRSLERSLAENRPRALVQMATGAGKSLFAVAETYRLVKFGEARRVLFLVDRGNLGRQALREFQHYVTPDDGRKFSELYNIQHLTSNRIDPVARVVITTIQRLYSMLRGEPELEADAEEGSLFDTSQGLALEPVPVAYNPTIPIETFDVVWIDECHRSIYTLWRQVLEYFDAFLVGLTATPAKQTFGFFEKNLVMEYGHERAVADGVNVDFDVYSIRTRITEQGSRVEAGPYEVVGKRDRATRAVRWERLDEDLVYEAGALDRSVVAKDQIRTVIQAFKDRLFTEIFPGRTVVPKTLIYAKDDSHADDIVQSVRDIFGKGNDFCQKITYRTGTALVVTKDVGPDGKEVERRAWKSTGVKSEDLLSAFRISFNPRIVVTVDMIATGTDVKPLEAVVFMREVKSRGYFEQMKGRGVRVISDSDFQSVTDDPAARSKTRFVIVDAVGICERELDETVPLDRKRTQSLDKLLSHVRAGGTDPDVLSSIASRLARLERQLTEDEAHALADLAGGATLGAIAQGIVQSLDPDRAVDAARAAAGLPPQGQPSAAQVDTARRALLSGAAAPLRENPALRDAILDTKRRKEQTIDEVSVDEVTHAGYSVAAKERAAALVKDFEAFLEEHRDEIDALQVLYSQPHAKRLRYADVKALAQAIQAPPRCWTPEALWRAYETLAKDRVRGASSRRLLTDVVSLVRFAIHKDDALVPFPERVEARFRSWIEDQERRGRRFTEEQRSWLELIRDQIAASLRIDAEDLDEVPFSLRGGSAKVYRLFGDALEPLLEELNEVLAA